MNLCCYQSVLYVFMHTFLVGSAGIIANKHGDLLGHVHLHSTNHNVRTQIQIHHIFTYLTLFSPVYEKCASLLPDEKYSIF